MIKILLIILITMLLPTFLLAQNTVDTTAQKKYKNAVFIELLGATGYLSLNYERDIQLYKELYLKSSVGVGYVIKTDYTPYVLSYTLRLDLQYGNKRIRPVVGYAFSHNFDLEHIESPYLVHSPNVGVNIRVLERLHLLPKYYMMFFSEPAYNSNYIVHWSGLQIKFNF